MGISVRSEHPAWFGFVCCSCIASYGVAPASISVCCEHFLDSFTAFILVFGLPIDDSLSLVQCLPESLHFSVCSSMLWCNNMVVLKPFCFSKLCKIRSNKGWTSFTLNSVGCSVDREGLLQHSSCLSDVCLCYFFDNGAPCTFITDHQVVTTIKKRAAKVYCYNVPWFILVFLSSSLAHFCSSS